MPGLLRLLRRINSNGGPVRVCDEHYLHFGVQPGTQPHEREKAVIQGRSVAPQVNEAISSGSNLLLKLFRRYSAKDLSIRSALDFQARRAELIIRVSKDSLACMLNLSFRANYQRSPQSAVPPSATG